MASAGCRRLVDSSGDVYTVEESVFARTYRRVGPGSYVKATPIWAERAEQAGSVQTKEGFTNYQRGDYIVSNGPRHVPTSTRSPPQSSKVCTCSTTIRPERQTIAGRAARRCT
jgi:hypothetical protein